MIKQPLTPGRAMIKQPLTPGRAMTVTQIKVTNHTRESDNCDRDKATTHTRESDNCDTD